MRLDKADQRDGLVDRGHERRCCRSPRTYVLVGIELLRRPLEDRDGAAGVWKKVPLEHAPGASLPDTQSVHSDVVTE